MKKLLTILFSLVSVVAWGQSTLPLKADSIKASGELVLRNQTRNIKGILFNVGGGVTKFIKSVALNDSTLIVGEDTITIRGTGAGSVETAANVGSGYAIYKIKNGTQFQFKTITSDTSLAFIVSADELKMVVDPGIFSSVRRLQDTAAAIRASVIAGGVSAEYVNQQISDAVNALPLFFDELFTNSGLEGSRRSLDTAARIATKPYVDVQFETQTERIDSIVSHWPAGGTGGQGRTTIYHTSSIGDSLLIKVNDSTYRMLKVIFGANMSRTLSDSTVTISSTPGSAEVNTVSFTLTTTGNRTVAAANIIEKILVRASSSLTGFKIGTLADDDFFFPATPVVADGEFATFELGAYLVSSTAVYFSGITASTDIKIITKPLHE
jgi:hypothetical protein